MTGALAMADVNAHTLDYLPKSAPVTRVRRKSGIDLSMTGLIFVAMLFFMGLAAVNSQANLLFGVFGLMIGVLIVSSLISRIVIRGIDVRRVVPDHGIVGRPMPVTYEFRNRKRLWPSLSITLAELDGVEGFTRQPMCYMLHAAPRTTAVVPSEFVPKRRGLHELDRYQISTSFPFGFIRRARTQRHKERVLVLPALADVNRQLLTQMRSAETTGPAMRPRPGGQDEFYGLKEYRAGESQRSIYWRRSARTGTLVSKQMTQVAPPRLLVLVDTFLADRSPEQHVLVERVIAMAASVASAALEEGLSVGMYAWSGDWIGVHPTRGKRHRDDLLSLMARLPLNAAHGTEELLAGAGNFLRAGTSAVLVTPRDVQVGLPDRTRTSMLVVSAAAPLAAAWFNFDPDVDFATCMPPDQQPKIGRRAAGRRQ
jgi:uncharacterized protein (DUF58 family)